MNTNQGRHGEFEPDKAHSTVVGIICPPGWDRVNCNPKFRQGPGLGGLSSRGGPVDSVIPQIGIRAVKGNFDTFLFAYRGVFSTGAMGALAPEILKNMDFEIRIGQFHRF